MKAIVKAKADVGLEMQEVEKPQIKPNEVLIRILKTAICGTDVSIYKWSPWAEKNVPVPLTIGHEFMGVIEEIGSDVIGYSIGQRVSGEGHLTCGKCRHCREGLRHFCPNTRGVGYHVNGCFAEYMALHEENVFPLPDDVSDNIGAIFDPYGNATYTALTCDLVGEDILITRSSPIGCMAAAICKKAALDLLQLQILIQIA